MSCGHIFQDNFGHVICCFHRTDTVGFTFEAEFIGVILALEIGHSKGLYFIWVEGDSSYVVNIVLYVVMRKCLDD